MVMAAYLTRKNIRLHWRAVHGTEPISTSANVGRLVNLTQRKYAYMRPGPGFHGSLANVDVSGDPSIDHINLNHLRPLLRADKNYKKIPSKSIFQRPARLCGRF